MFETIHCKFLIGQKMFLKQLFLSQVLASSAHNNGDQRVHCLYAPNMNESGRSETQKFMILGSDSQMNWECG